VERIAAVCGLDLIQLHGDESPAECRRLPAARIIKAVSPETAEALLLLEAYRVRAFIIDAREPGRYGGTGKRADWELAARLAQMRPLVLAGGLGLENMAAALAAVAPAAVDINSGCETAPGIKDHDRMRAIVALIRREGITGSAGDCRGRTPPRGRIFIAGQGPCTMTKTEDSSGCLEEGRGE
jgi:phosphoribosylanthranilate isomerase